MHIVTEQVSIKVHVDGAACAVLFRVGQLFLLHLTIEGAAGAVGQRRHARFYAAAGPPGATPPRRVLWPVRPRLEAPLCDESGKEREE